LRKKRITGQRALHPADILTSLKKAAEDKKKIFKTNSFVPEGYKVFLASTDLSDLKSLLKPLQAELVDELEKYIRKKGYQINSPDITIDFQNRHTLRQGELDVAGHFEKKEVTLEKTTEHKILLSIRPETPQQETVELMEGSYSLGRGRTADVQLPAEDQLISKIHCKLSIDKKAVFIEDLKSANGTILNGQLIADSQGIANGDRLLIGDTEIEICLKTDG